MGSEFPTDWQLEPLEDCMDAIIDYRGKTPRKTSAGIPLITAKVVKGGQIEPPNEFIDPKDYDEWMRRGLPKVGDVLLTTEAPLGEVAQLRESKVALAQRLIALRGQGGMLDNTFLKFLLQSDFVQEQLKARSSGTTVVGIKQSELRRVLLPLPTFSEQQAIACILGALDDKIEVNRRMNGTLEAMARAIFQDWFVEFGPVRAKAAGQALAGLSEAVAGLFPARLVEVAGRVVPEGWGIGTLSALAGFVLGGDWGKETTTDLTPMAAYCIRGADIPSLQSSGLGNMPVRFLKESSLEKRQLIDGDIVIEISGGSPTQSTGRPVLITDSLLARLDLPLVYSNFCRLFRPQESGYSRYIYLLLRSMYDSDTFLQYENGTTGIKNFAFSVFIESHVIAIPPKQVVEVLDTQLRPIFRKMQSLGSESGKLAALRDALLPKLIAGEVRVADAERVVGRCL